MSRLGVSTDIINVELISVDIINVDLKNVEQKIRHKNVSLICTIKYKFLPHYNKSFKFRPFRENCHIAI